NLQAKNVIFTLSTRVIKRLRLSNISSSSDDAKRSPNKLDEKKKSEDALKKLNNLLKTMIEEDVGNSKTKLNLAKPVNRRKNQTTAKDDTKLPKVDSPESIGGDVKQIESELLMKLLNPSHEDKTNTVTSLSDIVKGMKIEREDTNEQSRAQQVRQILQQGEKSNILDTKDGQKLRPRIARTQPPIAAEKIDLFGSEPLGIFIETQGDTTEGVQNKMWLKLYERDLKLAVTHPPNNYFQQMVLWTEQGKVWKFPIDNEQGLEEEQKAYFAEHVFLEKHLEQWCPHKGPIRHFMELVCVGLSKNPYLTVEAKKEHIEWFKNYFEDKKQLLKEVGAFQEPDAGKANHQKQIE
ncbi:mitochondrial ribosomal protein S31, partial [Asbolus verrucosus]